MREPMVSLVGYRVRTEPLVKAELTSQMSQAPNACLYSFYC